MGGEVVEGASSWWAWGSRVGAAVVSLLLVVETIDCEESFDILAN